MVSSLDLFDLLWWHQRSPLLVYSTYKTPLCLVHKVAPISIIFVAFMIVLAVLFAMFTILMLFDVYETVFTGTTSISPLCA